MVWKSRGRSRVLTEVRIQRPTSTPPRQRPLAVYRLNLTLPLLMGIADMFPAIGQT